MRKEHLNGLLNPRQDPVLRCRGDDSCDVAGIFVLPAGELAALGLGAAVGLDGHAGQVGLIA